MFLSTSGRDALVLETLFFIGRAGSIRLFSHLFICGEIKTSSR